MRWLGGLLALLLLASAATALVPVPALKARVTDLTSTLSAEDSASLEATLNAFETRKGAQLAVLIVPSTQPEAIEQYSLRVAEAWKLGRAKPDDGALLLIAKDDHRMRIEVGYGLEGALNDATSKRIIDEIITPKFKAGDFAGGIRDGVGQMLAVIDGEALPPPSNPPRQSGATQNNFGGMMVGLLIFAGLMHKILRSGVAKLMAGVVAGGLVFVLSHSLIIALAAVAVIWVLSLIGFGPLMTGGSYYASSGRGGFGGDRFGGGGGFSGGGGGFGGGGASGGW